MTEEFTEQILKIIISKVAQQYGFIRISETALSILIDVIIERITDICEKTTKITSHSGRFDSNGIDLFLALSFYSETPETLADFINKTNFPSFEYLIEPYPVINLPNLEENKENKDPISLSFRTNFLPNYKNLANSHIFSCFPDLSSENNPNSNQNSNLNDNKKNNENRSEDENNLKKTLGSLLSNINENNSQSYKFDCNLKDLLENQIITQPTPLLKSPLNLMTGNRQELDPEHLPQILPKDDDPNLELNRDHKLLIKILKTQHDSKNIGKSHNNIEH